MSSQPEQLAAIQKATKAKGFDMASEPELGSLLRTLVAIKPDGHILELGTGTGLSTAWLLDGMDAAARLLSVDRDLSVQDIARRYLGTDSRCTFLHQEVREFLLGWDREPFDMIFADAWSGKFFELDEALGLLKPGGLYVVDDLQPLPTWPEGHAAKVEKLLEQLSNKPELILAKLELSTGILIAAKRLID